jgi:hypothetical protein
VTLPDFVLPTRAGAQWDHSGIDTKELCLNPQHFKQYPYSVQYTFNSRGFRDAEWPETMSELQAAIWCVGDSFTVGLGSAKEHVWPTRLQQHTGRRCINVSLDGASNDWIARKTCAILDTIVPDHIVIHWSYWHRREAPVEELLEFLAQQAWPDFYAAIKNPDWPLCSTWDQVSSLPASIQQEIKRHWVEPTIEDEDLFFFSNDERRRSAAFVVDDQENFQHIKHCIDRVQAACTNTKIIHSFIPEFTNQDLYCKKSHSVDKLTHLVNAVTAGIDYVPYFAKLDLARDGHHYDVKTAEYFVQQLLVKL